MRKFLKAGKLNTDILKGLLERSSILDPQVVVGPKIGEDAAVIDLGKEADRYWVVTSDPITFTTEGGLINGMIEMALASEKEMEVDLERVLIYKESLILCREFGLNPLGVIASGALLLTVSPTDFLPIQKAFRKNGIPLNVIGNVKKGSARVLTSSRKGRKELKPLPQDEILKIY